MAGITQSRTKRLAFIVVPQDRTKMKETSKQTKKKKQTNKQTNKKNKKKKHENGCVKGKHTNIYPSVYIHTPTDKTYTYRYSVTKTYIHTDTHMHLYKSHIQVYYSSHIVFFEILFESI